MKAAITPQGLGKYRYVYGFLLQLKQYFQDYSEVVTYMNKSVQDLSNAVTNFDAALEAVYYLYVNEYLKDTGHEGDEGSKGVCDKVLMNNYFIEGMQMPQQIEPYKELQRCPNIKASCCEESQVDAYFANFNDNQQQVLNLKLNYV